MIFTNHKYLVHSILLDIEVYDVKIRVSHGFQNCQLMACVAESQRGSSFALCLQYMQNIKTPDSWYLLKIYEHRVERFLGAERDTGGAPRNPSRTIC